MNYKFHFAPCITWAITLCPRSMGVDALLHLELLITFYLASMNLYSSYFFRYSFLLDFFFGTNFALLEPKASIYVQWTVQVEPKFHEDASNLEELVPFEECIELHSSEEMVVQAPEYLMLTHNGRSFKLVPDSYHSVLCLSKPLYLIA